MKDIVLMNCLALGEIEQFGRYFARWQELYQKPRQGEEDDTFNIFFRALAGDWSQQKERLLLAEFDDRERREQKQTPLDSLNWLLCWYGYFKMMDDDGAGKVSLLLGGDAEEDRREYSCREAAEYFERQADLLGEQMDRARERFCYGELKKGFEECLQYRR